MAEAVGLNVMRTNGSAGVSRRDVYPALRSRSSA